MKWEAIIKQKFFNSQGFTLVELMVVVAIIGIFASMAVPSFKRILVNAKKAEVRSNLGAFYQAASGSYLDYGFYPGNLPATGFFPEGLLKYEYTSLDNGNNSCGSYPLPPLSKNCQDSCITTGRGGSTTTVCNSYLGTVTWEDIRPLQYDDPALKLASLPNPVTLGTLDTFYIMGACAGHDGSVLVLADGTRISIAAEPWNCWTMDNRKMLVDRY